MTMKSPLGASPVSWLSFLVLPWPVSEDFDEKANRLGYGTIVETQTLGDGQHLRTFSKIVE